MKRRIYKGVGCLAIVLALTSVNIALAASATSSKSTQNVNGYSYTYLSSVHNDSSSTWAATDVQATTTVPTGYMGVLPRLYNSSGTLVKSGSWTYNESAYSGMSVLSGDYSLSGTYYSCGQVSLYNGNGYSTYNTNKSPNLTRSSSTYTSNNTEQTETLELDTSYSVNENGETYGLGLSASTIGEEPDLIKALGIDGTLGYVRSNDFGIANPKSPEEAIANQNTDCNIIPLYDKDGENIIGSFEISETKVSAITK